ncbi:MAG: DUF3048 domain-containing protein [Patescibacteria group bacterium]|jgi:hypothetical protein
MEDLKLKLTQLDPGKFLKKYWPYLAGGVILVLLASYGLFKFAIAGHNDAQANMDGSNSSTVAATSTEGLVGRKLDGVLVKPEDAQLLPMAIMVEMHPDAMPLSGISKASLVFEAPVEGGITRLMAVFDATTTVPSVGPVRSARPYFVEWADALHAVYAHVGGSPEALNRIAGLLKLHNLDEIASGKYFWRSKGRGAPHNTYTDQQMLLSAIDSKNWQAISFATWSYDDSTSTARGDVLSIKIPYGGSYNVEWRFDQEKDLYTRYQAGKRFADADGSVVKTRNILVLTTEQRVLDDYGRLYIRTTGSGKATLYRDGYKQDVRWSRSPSENIRIETTDGRAVAMGRGTTWIEVITQLDQVPTTSTASSTSGL